MVHPVPQGGAGAPPLRRDDERPRAALGVAFQDKRRDALAFTREFRWRFPNIRDPRGKLAARYELIGLPTSYVIDAQGRIARQLTGEQNFGSLRRAVEEVE